MKNCPHCGSKMKKAIPKINQIFQQSYPTTGLSAVFPNVSGAPALSDRHISTKKQKEFYICENCGYKTTIYEINFDDFNRMISGAKFQNDGDEYERKYAELITPHFPNYEIFWKYFIFPMTKRIEKANRNSIGHRDDISLDILEIAYLSYSIFVPNSS